MKTKHTHQGTCQACGAVQAIDNTTKLIAKHGYTVAGWGFFNGTCSGSARLPAELEVLYTYKIIDAVTEHAIELERLSALYANGDLMVYTWTKSVYTGYASKHVTKTFPMFGCTDDQVAHQRAVQVDSLESSAKMARAHADSLRRCVLPRLGKPLYPVTHAVVRQFAAGDVVKLYGKDFVLVAPRYGMSSNSTPKFWKGYYKDDADKKMFFPTIRTLRSQN